jgi:O-antigen/teichoic acid export membrane protein
MKQRLISIPFFLLRTGTAGAALVTGLLQTFVFAHVLSPHRFSIFILVAAVGYSLWLIDFGIVKILFVQQRARFLAGDRSDEIARQATAIVLFYFGLVSSGALLCFLFMAIQTSTPLQEAVEFGLFFLLVALNLVWFALRYVSIAVDEYVLFEALETMRRGGYIVGLIAVLFGLPLIVMLIALNALWAVVVTICVKRMVVRDALRPRIDGWFENLRAFFRANRIQIIRSGTYAVSEIYVSNYPYFIVPLLFGLGAPPIILDTTFKVFKGGAVIFAAVCDILVPRQTSALAERNGPTLVRATLLAAALCSIPAAFACGVLFLAADKFFAFLLGNAATMPPATTPILIVLLIANLTQMVTYSVLVHNGFFKEMARIGMGLAAAMTCLAVFAVFVRLDIVQFLEAYVAIYSCSAIVGVVLMIRGPFRLAHEVATPGGECLTPTLRSAPSARGAA